MESFPPPPSTKQYVSEHAVLLIPFSQYGTGGGAQANKFSCRLLAHAADGAQCALRQCTPLGLGVIATNPLRLGPGRSEQAGG